MKRISFAFALAVMTLLSASAQETSIARVSLDTLYLSSDGGKTWTSQDAYKVAQNRAVYLTSVSRNTVKPDWIVVGTSYQGIWESKDGGKTWVTLTDAKPLSIISHGAGFYNEVDGIQYTADATGSFYFKVGFNGKTSFYDRTKKTVKELADDDPAFANLGAEFQYTYDLANTNPRVDYTLPDAPDPRPDAWSRPVPTDAASILSDDARAARREKASKVRAFYVKPTATSPTELAKYLAFAIDNGLNAIIVDLKDDFGFVTYPTQNPIAIENKAIQKRFVLTDLLKAAHDKGIYVIGRIPVFKDKQLYRYQKNAYALWDRYKNGPWGFFKTEDQNGQKVTYQVDYWVDEFSDFVHQYNIALAKEAETLGVDEVQFDYIRFPSDGPVNDYFNRFHVDEKGATVKTNTGAERVAALSDFLRKAREQLTVPISIDVYGFNGWARMSYLGQDVQALSYYCDVISPMLYPSHYDARFYSWLSYLDKTSLIYEKSTERSRIMTGDRVLIRPYVQAFRLGGELRFSEATYFDYVNRQIISLAKAGGVGFSLWNASGDYYMLQPKKFKQLLESIYGDLQ